MTDDRDLRNADMNPDPITGAPGSHPIGTGLGAGGGGAAGAVAGAAVGGPIGAVIGGVAGAVIGGLSGKGVAEVVNPTAEDAYWRTNHASQAYAGDGAYDRFQPAYKHGWESFGRYEGKRFDDVEMDLKRDWEKTEAAGSMGWDKAKQATRSAWHRVEKAMPGDADGDGR